uniref:Carbohydrate kinase FGGY N-terminal domain-containing protein n=1 Tax=Romanomermis culicivorax TaxID=13658 RepID=A0A915KQ49_ROMCU
DSKHGANKVGPVLIKIVVGLRKGSSKIYQQEKLIISVDVGSSFIKCVIYDGKFSIRGKSSVKLDTCVHEDGGCEIDPDHLWQQFLTCIRDAIETSHCALKDILAMGFCTQRNTFITWNKLMYTLSNKKRFAASSIYQLKCGMVTPRLLWAIQTNQQLREAIEVDKVYFGGIETWLLWKLTNGEVLQSEISLASSTGMFDPFMMGDQQAGTFGCCCFDFGSIKLTLGTGMFMDMNTGNAAHASLRGIYPLVGWKINEDLTYLAEISAKDAGSALLWAQSIG